MEIIETLYHKGCKIEISRDECNENPIKEGEVLGEFICWHKRYDLGNSDCFDNPKEAERYAKRTRSMLFPLYMYDHSGIALSLSNEGYPFNDRWDAGQLGYILADREKILREYDSKILTKKIRKKVRNVIYAEVNMYNQYLNGDIYTFITYDEYGEEIDSCGGNYGMDYTIEAAKESVDLVASCC
jgi:hypothetical protein